ncbi:MAG: ABC transporter ATP-binding protein [Acidimicrobiia bacterium]|nr:MAG: ABC transporter ATP-binding protein [Acidimicrobiia bacterium]
MILEARDVTVRYGGLVALDGVSLAVPDRSIVGLIGPNGAGKTTFFGVLSGLVRPRAGTVALAGADVTRRSPQARARLGLARTFQRLELFGELTVREHVLLAHRQGRGSPFTRFARDLVGLGARTDPEEDAAVTSVLELFGLAAAADRPAAALGLGTGRLVELARAVATRPRVLLLDEPSSGLDARETAQLAEVLRRLRDDRDVALVLVEHDVEMVLSLARRVTVLDFGQVIAEGTPDEIRADAAVQAAYLGTTT